METGGVNRGSSNRISVYPRCVGISARKQGHIIAACSSDSHTETTAKLKATKHVIKALSMKRYQLPFLLACCINCFREKKLSKKVHAVPFSVQFMAPTSVRKLRYFVIFLRHTDSASCCSLHCYITSYILNYIYAAQIWCTSPSGMIPYLL